MTVRSVNGVIGAIGMALGVTLAACESTTGPEQAASVSVAFRAVGPGVSASSVAASTGAAGARDIPGSNGVLSLSELSFIVAEFELEQVESACRGADDGPDLSRVADDDDEGEHGDGEDDDHEDGDDHACEEFEAPPSFVQLSLDGVEEPAVTRPVAAGVYREVEFEIEDLEADEGEDGGAIAALLDEIRAIVPDWPERASMLASGTFTPTGGTAIPFRVFFAAEIEIEREFEPPLDLTAGDEATVTIVVDPAAFFLRPDGTVLDLSEFDGQVIEFEADMEHGFSGVESERHGDHEREDDGEGEDR